MTKIMKKRGATEVSYYRPPPDAIRRLDTSKWKCNTCGKIQNAYWYLRILNDGTEFVALRVQCDPGPFHRERRVLDVKGRSDAALLAHYTRWHKAVPPPGQTSLHSFFSASTKAR